MHGLPCVLPSSLILPYFLSLKLSCSKCTALVCSLGTKPHLPLLAFSLRLIQLRSHSLWREAFMPQHPPLPSLRGHLVNSAFLRASLPHKWSFWCLSPSLFQTFLKTFMRLSLVHLFRGTFPAPDPPFTYFPFNPALLSLHCLWNGLSPLRFPHETKFSRKFYCFCFVLVLCELDKVFILQDDISYFYI